MNFVLFHIGDTLPGHIKYCVTQILNTNPNSKIYIITNLNIETQNKNVICVNTANLYAPDIGTYYINDTYSSLWRTSVLRLFYIEDFLRNTNIQDVIHFDNDVLLYRNLNKYIDIFKKFNFLITSHFEKEYVFGFSYIKNSNSLTEINKQLLSLVRRGETQLLKDIDCKGSMPHEMRLLCYINEVNNNSLIDQLPVTPFGPGSNNFNLFNACFDPSSYGKHLGGSHEHTQRNSNFVSTSEWTGTEKHHYVGRCIINDNLKVKFDNKLPTVIVKNISYDIINLHIHTKELQKWM